MTDPAMPHDASAPSQIENNAEKAGFLFTGCDTPETLLDEILSLRAKREADARVVAAAEALIEHYAAEDELTGWLMNDPVAEELCAAVRARNAAGEGEDGK